jgi:hypothetical protein
MAGELPSRAYMRGLKTNEYRPLIGGTWARLSASDSAMGTYMPATVSAATKSPLKYDQLYSRAQTRTGR